MGLIGKFKDGLSGRKPRVARDVQAVENILGAAATGDMAVLRKYFQGFAYEEAPSISGSALIEACIGGQTEAARFMLDFGVPVDVKMLDGTTPETAAFERGHDAVLVLLHEYTVKAGKVPGKPLADAHKKALVAEASAIAPILQRDIAVRNKPLKYRKPGQE
jgi:ankyrin repeat protein